MGTQGTGRKRISSKEKLTAEDDALNVIAREAEALLAAKRAARAEAREIRMKELERQQKEGSDDEERVSVGSRGSVRVEDGDTPEKGSRTASTLPTGNLTALSGSSLQRGSGEALDTEAYIREIKDSLVEVEEKYRRAMVSNAQLDNEKSNLMYQVETLKDSLMELEEQLSEARRECQVKATELEREKQSHSILQFQFSEMKETLKHSEELLTKHGIFLGSDLTPNGEMGESLTDGLASAESAKRLAQDSQAADTGGESMLGNAETVRLEGRDEVKEAGIGEIVEKTERQTLQEEAESHKGSTTELLQEGKSESELTLPGPCSQTLASNTEAPYDSTPRADGVTRGDREEGDNEKLTECAQYNLESKSEINMHYNPAVQVVITGPEGNIKSEEENYEDTEEVQGRTQTVGERTDCEDELGGGSELEAQAVSTANGDNPNICVCEDSSEKMKERAKETTKGDALETHGVISKNSDASQEVNTFKSDLGNVARSVDGGSEMEGKDTFQNKMGDNVTATPESGPQSATSGKKRRKKKKGKHKQNGGAEEGASRTHEKPKKAGPEDRKRHNSAHDGKEIGTGEEEENERVKNEDIAVPVQDEVMLVQEEEPCEGERSRVEGDKISENCLPDSTYTAEAVEEGQGMMFSVCDPPSVPTSKDLEEQSREISKHIDFENLELKGEPETSDTTALEEAGAVQEQVVENKLEEKEGIPQDLLNALVDTSTGEREDAGTNDVDGCEVDSGSSEDFKEQMCTEAVVEQQPISTEEGAANALLKGSEETQGDTKDQMLTFSVDETTEDSSDVVRELATKGINSQNDEGQSNEPISQEQVDEGKCPSMSEIEEDEDGESFEFENESELDLSQSLSAPSSSPSEGRMEVESTAVEQAGEIEKRDPEQAMAKGDSLVPSARGSGSVTGDANQTEQHLRAATTGSESEQDGSQAGLSSVEEGEKAIAFVTPTEGRVSEASETTETPPEASEVQVNEEFVNGGKGKGKGKGKDDCRMS